MVLLYSRDSALLTILLMLSSIASIAVAVVGSCVGFNNRFLHCELRTADAAAEKDKVCMYLLTHSLQKYLLTSKIVRRINTKDNALEKGY